MLSAATLAACSHSGVVPAVATNAANARFQTNSSGGYEVIYSFAAAGRVDDGASPASGLVEVDSAFYGTTQYGGKTSGECPIGCGTVFRIGANGKESVIYRFGGGKDGAVPVGGLTVVRGALFGTTSGGGGASACAAGCGTVFTLTTSGTSEKVLHRFAGAPDGADPLSTLIVVGSVLYGTTQFGGTVTNLCSSGCGTVFKITTSGSESSIHRFKGRSDGAYPTGGLLALHGQLYGTTEYGGSGTRFCATGCGTIFRMNTGGTKKTLHDFAFGRASDGAYPAASLVATNGVLYGTTSGGGAYGDGTVFSANPSSGTDKLLHSFQCCQKMRDGSYPIAPLTPLGSKLYGVTYDGGISNNGTVFVVTSSGVETLLHQFTGTPDGAAPEGVLALSRGKFYGTTTSGGSVSAGTIFRITP